MAIGNNIRNLRMKKGMTQKDLADSLNVTFQAVSRWENDNVEPSIDMLQRLTEVLDCSLNDLFGQVTPKPDPEVVERVVIQDYKPVLAVCERCNRPIYESYDLVRFSTTDSVRHGRAHRSVETKHVHCKSCNEKRLQEERQARERKQQEFKAKLRSRRIKSFIVGGLIALVFFAFAIYGFVANDTDTGIGSIFLAVTGFTLSSCLILRNTFIADMWLEIVSWGFVKMPGIIFSLDLGGFVFLIVVKILFFILGIIFVFIAVIAATLLALLLSVAVYPFALVKNIRGKENMNEVLKTA